jgi:hypothetical protein
MGARLGRLERLERSELLEPSDLSALDPSELWALLMPSPFLVLPESLADLELKRTWYQNCVSSKIPFRGR